MTALPRLIAFDLDDTLAPSKSPLRPQMAELLVRLLDRTEVCVISGGQFGQFDAQVIQQLAGATAEQLERLHLMPTCGTQYYRYADAEWEQVYAQNLTESERDEALAVVEAEARALGFWEAETWGPILEDRGSQVTFSALGQAAPVEAKMQWDPSGAKKNALRDAVQVKLPLLEVRSGGSTSIDITRRGIDKAYGMTRLADVSGVPLEEMLFIGDRLDENGNDYPVKVLGVECVAVEGWEHTVTLLERMLDSSAPRSAAMTA
ncbi:HAD-IIB family hydrolase [Agromyces sp. LHK192]|uniref:HAD-IIB family hydrolase n=1 Tax=Agromyces sp. LHK192 TaxID=2498704 RepID=UPI000FDC9805|nr:HAD-IIB family hydrolase [Agromyces sp. LHK192]